jgi:tRNA dimethylallyltransferase
MFLLTGPTASGKSSLALELARRIGGEVVNADAFQLYAELPIITAQPTQAERSELPHHLYGVLSVTQRCDAQRYHDLASAVIQEIASRGKWPIVVGGSGLYVKSLTHGLAPLPPVPESLRAEVASFSKQERIARLLALDPEAKCNVPLENDRYVSRALEVCLVTGLPQSTLRSQWQQAQPQFHGIILQRERTDLVERINLRTETMFEAGIIDEVKALPTHSPNAEKAIGVQQVRAHLAGEFTKDEAMEAIRVATRQYAKRQATWFRRETGYTRVEAKADQTNSALADQILQRYPMLSAPLTQAHL